MRHTTPVALCLALCAVACKEQGSQPAPAGQTGATAQQPAAAPSAPKPLGATVKVGVLTDMTGAYSDIAGPGSVAAARMAIDDYGGKVNGKQIEMISADHQNKADISSNTARKWFDEENVNVIVDLVSSSTALAVMPVAKAKNRITLLSGPASTKITNEACTDTNVHYTYDTYSLAVGTGREVVREGGDSWFFITADYAFGYSLEADTTAQIKAGGGKVLGTVKAPFPTTDFSSYLLQAKSSGAKVIGLANAGADTINSVKQAHEFGIVPKQMLAGLLVFLSDVHSLGLNSAKGLLLTESFYWDRDDETRKWSQRFFEKTKKMPTMVHAGVYSSLMHYFKAIDAAKSEETQAVMAKMREMPVNDFFAKNGHIRADGLHVHDMYLYEVKSPEESKKPWDYYKLKKQIPADQAFKPLAESLCPLVKK
jgi:branched-chain amino acid transport system substrate-binding protein